MGIETIKELINTVIAMLGVVAFWYLSILGEKYNRTDTELTIWAVMTFGFMAYLIVSFAHFIAFLLMGV